jgi:hypothetical protein
MHFLHVSTPPQDPKNAPLAARFSVNASIRGIKPKSLALRPGFLIDLADRGIENLNTSVPAQAPRHLLVNERAA